MNLPDPSEGSASPYSGNRLSIQLDLGGERVGHPPTIRNSQSLLSRSNQVIEAALSPSLDGDAEIISLDMISHPAGPSTLALSRSSTSSDVMTKWVEAVYYKWVPLADTGNELRHLITSALIHPTSVDRSPHGMSIPMMRGPDVESIAACLLDLIGTYTGGPATTMSNGVILNPGFHVRNLFNRVRSWHA
jgi:hypothetical protein